MRIIITGATGFIGQGLCEDLANEGHEVIALSRNPNKKHELKNEHITVVKWDGKTSNNWKDYADGAYAIVNLTGENISGYWSRDKKKAILESRLEAGQAIVSAIKEAKNKPKLLIQGSAIGYYGTRSDEILDEQSSYGKGFLSGVAQKWEASTKEVEFYGVKHIIVRTGVVLGISGGALPNLISSFKIFLGGPSGSGKHWFSWIHLNDEIKAIKFLLENNNSEGIYNLTAPNPITMKDFCHILGKSLNKPSQLSVPGFAIRMILGEMAEELILGGQRVIPKKLIEDGYNFLYPEIEPALNDIFKE